MSAARTLSVFLPDLTATQELGRKIGRLVCPGAVIALVGALGAGKTHLARAISEGLEIPDSRLVTSPTFVLIQEYPGRLPIYHFDAYRLSSSRAFAELGVSEYLEGDGVCLIEWADRVEPCLPSDFLSIKLQVRGDTSRQAVIEAHGEQSTRLLLALEEI